MSEVKLESVTTDVTILRERVLAALQAFADRDEGRERRAVDVLAEVATFLDRSCARRARSKRTKKGGSR